MKKTLLLIFILVISITTGYAADCRVTKTADTNDGACTAGDCSLREAVAEPSCSNIDFSLDLVEHPILLTLGEITIARALAIKGWGADAITISGNNMGSIFAITADNVKISNVTLTGGNGGAVRGNRYTLDGVYVTGNQTGSLFGIIGGGVGVVIRNSTISGNTAPISDLNSAVIVAGTIGIYNSSICNNSGAAIYTSGGLVSAYNSTIANNAPQGIIIQDAGIFTIGNTIALGSFTDHSFRGDVESFGNNIVSDAPGSWPMFYQQSDLQDTDPMLGPVSYQGGSIPVCGLLPGSPAIDAGNNLIAINVGLSMDQRGFGRFADGNGDSFVTVDIGAVEFGSTPVAAPVSISGRLLTAGGMPIRSASIVLSDLHGNVRYAVTSSLGWFTFDQVPANIVYKISISSKRYFAPEKVIFADQSVTDADIIATPYAERGK